MADRLAEVAVETSTFARLISFYPYQGARSFQLQLFLLASSRARFQPLSQLKNFNQTYPRSATVARKNSGILSGWQRRNDRRLAWLSRSKPAVLDRADLVAGDDPSGYRCLPVIIRSEEIGVAIEQPNERVG